MSFQGESCYITDFKDSLVYQTDFEIKIYREGQIMKFQCGECGKNYRFNEAKIKDEGVSLKCDNCSNMFFINGALVFSSTNQNSKLICHNCGEMIHERNLRCNKCNLILNKTREDLRIDNKYYENFGLEEQQEAPPAVVEPENSRKWQYSILAVFLVVVAASGSYYFFAHKTQSANAGIFAPIEKIFPKKQKKVEKDVVIMKSGEIYYVENIENDGEFLILTHRNGAKNKISQEEVLTISKAIIEQ